MYFSKSKAQSAQVSMTDLASPVASRPGSAIQKNMFNFNIYFAEREPSLVSNSGSHQSSSAAIAAGSQISGNNTCKSQASSNFTGSHFHRGMRREGEQSGARILMQHSVHKFKPVGKSSKGLNVSTSMSHLNNLTQIENLNRHGGMTPNLNTNSYFSGVKNGSNILSNKNCNFSGNVNDNGNACNNISSNNSSSNSNNNGYSNSVSSKRSVTRIKLVGFSGDPEFQHVKDTSYKIMEATEGMLQLRMDEIDNEIDYDTRLKQLKRSSSAFLPAYKAFKCGNSSLHQDSMLTQQLPLTSVQHNLSGKRPFYFLTDKNEPLFSLKQLQDKFPMKPSAQQIIEANQDSLSKLDLVSLSQADFFKAGLLPSMTDHSRQANTISSRAILNTSSSSTNYLVNEMNERKHVYLQIRTSQKQQNRDSLVSPSHPGSNMMINFDSIKTTDNPGSANGCPTAFSQQWSGSIPTLNNLNSIAPSQSSFQQWPTSTTSFQNYNNGEPFKLIIELYTKVAPKACDNFLKLCDGFITSEGTYLTFRNTMALRFKKNGFIQLGYSKPGVSIYNGYFEDESFAVQHDRPGIIGYCNRGAPHSNSSQFYITLGAMPSFDKKMVAFGRVISGFKHLEKFNKVLANSFSEIPPFNIIICDSGVVQSRPSTNQSRISSSSNVPAFKSPNGHDQFNSFSEADRGLEDDTYRVVRPDIFTYKGEKTQKFQTYENYVIGEAEKHKEVALTEYISLMLAFQGIAYACQEIITNSYEHKTIESLREAMKNAFVNILSSCSSVALLYDTKEDKVYIESNLGKFVVAFTSLDVDNLCDTSSCGSMFLIFRKTTTSFRPAKRSDLLQSGESISGAGYIMYGQSTQIVFHTGYRLNGFTYDPESNLFILTHPRIKAPKKGGIISCDEANLRSADENISKFIRRRKIIKESYVTRYVGSKVADFHRTLLYGGILIYPQKQVNIYDAFTLSYLIDKAWDRSSSGQDGQILIKKPIELTENVQLYIGYSQDVLELDNLYLSIRRKNSLYKIHELPSSKTIKSTYSINKQPTNPPAKVA